MEPMDKEVSVIAVVIVTIVLVFVILQPIIPTNSEKFSEIGVLGPNQTIANYPKDITAANNTFTLFGYIGNHEGAVEYYHYVALLGNNNTVVTNTTSATAPVLETYSYVLGDGQNVTFPISLTIKTSGENMKLIFELWDYDQSSDAFVYTGLWNQLWINATI
jgi:uncharacterized membrane protein